jgi:hypothetical protein
MITLKIIALVLGAGMLTAFVFEEIGTDLLLAIVTCLS